MRLSTRRRILNKLSRMGLFAPLSRSVIEISDVDIADEKGSNSPEGYKALSARQGEKRNSPADLMRSHL